MKQPIPFGKYYLLERINVGGMAEVYKAKATGVEGFERMVAVKRILPSIAEDEEFITMFVDEAKIAVQLTHASIAQIFDLGKVEDSYFIALEYVHGKDLRAIFNRARARGEQLPIPLCCYAIMKVCEGLDYAHNKRDAAGHFLNLVHRDVSPQNILVSYEGEVKIIDFGIAKAAGKAGKTQAGILKGKFGYMSPEQVLGLEIDRRSDVFGVGICLYELLTGERLFIGESDFATLEKVRNVDIMPPSTYNRRIPEDLEQIVLKALARDRANRHQTAMQLHDELQSFMYTSGNFFGRRDLSMYMHRAFGEEIEKEGARDQEYAALDMPPLEEVTGLSAFEELDPVSTVSALQATPSAPPLRQPASIPASGRSFPPASTTPSAPAPPRGHKATLLGMPAVAPGAVRAATMQQPRPSVPPLIPRPQSIPPSHTASAGAQPSGLDMGWDDEELSTQIYDRPEDHAPPVPAATAAPTAPISGSYPPVLRGPASAPPGQHLPAATQLGHPGVPSPFANVSLSQGPAPTAQFSPASTGYPGDAPLEYPDGRQERRPMFVAVVSVVAIVGLIMIGLWIFRPPAPGTVHLSTTPNDVSVLVDGKAVVGSSPFVIGEIEPGSPHEVIVSKQGYKTWTSRFEVQPAETMELPPVVLEAEESGFALDSIPSGAEVFIDGVASGKETPVRVTDLAPGDHQIRLVVEGHSPWESSLHVTPGTVLELPRAQLLELPPTTEHEPKRRVEPPRPTVRPPRPEVATPRPKPSPEVEDDGEVEPEPEPAKPSAVASAGGSGTLRVQTRPWSTVFVDGRLVGPTPQMAIQLSAGTHTVTFVNDDFGLRKTIKIDIGAGETVTKVLTLAE